MTLADVTAFPFLKYGWVHDPDDDEPFHAVLAEHLALDPRHAALRIWIERMDGQPRAGIAATAANSARSGA
jgi:glutathione S-transferase